MTEASRNTLSRRDLLLGRLGIARGTPAPSDAGVAPPGPPRVRPRLPAPLRPPGAIPEDEFADRCTRCGECERACPVGAIRPAPRPFGSLANTPWIDPFKSPCQLCEDFPCIAACETGALDLERAGRMGTAQVRAPDCLNRLGSPCSICEERCPVPGALVVERGVPRVEPGLCVGCGTCAYVCPAPERAILILPAPRRAEGA